MKNRSDKKRFYFACLLLLAFCLQRIIGIVGSEIVYAIEVESRMNAVEQTIAEKFKKETGVEIQIKLEDDDQMDWLLNLGYSAPFIFSDKIDDQIHYFTIEKFPDRIVTYAYHATDQPDQQVPVDNPRNFKDRLFSDFYFWESGLSFKKFSMIKPGLGLFPLFRKNPFIAIPSPPPKLA